MHRCQVMMVDVDADGPESDGYPCGDEAPHKWGFLWICSYHFGLFSRFPGAAEHESTCRGITDGVSRPKDRSIFSYWGSI